MTDTNKKNKSRGIILAVTIALIVGLAGVSFASRGHGFGFGVGHGGNSGHNGCGITQGITDSGSTN